MSFLLFLERAYYDVAIIEMDKAVKLSNFVYPICIPETAKEIDNRKAIKGPLLSHISQHHTS